MSVEERMFNRTVSVEMKYNVVPTNIHMQTSHIMFYYCCYDYLYL